MPRPSVTQSVQQRQPHPPHIHMMNWVNQLAPQGKLRVCINLGNALLAQLEPLSQKPQGLSVEIAQAFTHTHGLELEMHIVRTAKESVAAVANKTADIGFFAIDPGRGKDIAFTKPYVYIDACYVVREHAGIDNVQEIDQKGIRIVVGLGSAYDLFLSRHIQHAELIRAPSTQDVMPLFLKSKHEVAAGLQHSMAQEIKNQPSLKMLAPPFMAIAQAIGCHPNQSDEVKTGLQAFLEKQLPDIKARIAQQASSGVRAALDNNT